MNVTEPSEPGTRKHRKSVPGTFSARRNSPLAQSPMIWKAASLLMTMAEARFQSRPEKLSSTKPRSVSMRVNASTISGELRAAGSRSTKARL
ncbi:hypothetical protein D3C72_2239070 [compost metagenome]